MCTIRLVGGLFLASLSLRSFSKLKVIIASGKLMSGDESSVVERASALETSAVTDAVRALRTREEGNEELNYTKLACRR